jgi:acyl carrier protein
MAVTDVALRVREFVIENFLFGSEGEGLSDDDSFLDRGIIDSTGVLELVTFLEETFRIEIDDEELVPANLDSIHRVARFVTHKVAGL